MTMNCLFSLVKSSTRRLHLIVAFCLLLGLTNATNNNTTTSPNTAHGFFGNLGPALNQMWRSLNSDSNGNLTTNETANTTEPSIFSKPKTIGDFQRILTFILRFLAQLLMIVSQQSTKTNNFSFRCFSLVEYFHIYLNI